MKILVPGVAVLAILTAAACDSSGDPDSAPPVTTTISGSASSSPAPSNGIEDENWSKILDRAYKASLAAKSVRVKGTMVSDGDKMTMDLHVSSSGLGSGYLIMNGERMDLIRIRGTIYIKGDRKWLMSVGGKDAVRTLSGKYMKGSIKDAELKDIADFLSMKFLAITLDAVKQEKGVLRKDGETTVNGRPAVGLKGSDGRLFVATDGEPQVLRIATFPNEKEPALLDFTYNAVVTVKAPPRSKIVDV